MRSSTGFSRWRLAKSPSGSIRSSASRGVAPQRRIASSFVHLDSILTLLFTTVRRAGGRGCGPAPILDRGMGGHPFIDAGRTSEGTLPLLYDLMDQLPLSVAVYGAGAG